jgi:hypothetical protein
MNKSLAISAIGLVAVVMGMSILTPALATHEEDHKRNWHWLGGYCSENNLCPVFVDVDRDGVCNLLVDVVQEMPRGFAERLPVYNENCIIVF